MVVTLKKAAALSSGLAALQLPLNRNLVVSVFSDANIKAEAEAATQELGEQIAKAMNVQETIYHIRGLIGRANEGEINSLLTERAFLDKQLALLNPLFSADTRPPDWDAIARRREQMRASPEGPYGRTADAISVQLNTNDLVRDNIRAAKKRRLAVEDRLAELNYKTTIELPEEAVTLLTEFDLI